MKRDSMTAASMRTPLQRIFTVVALAGLAAQAVAGQADAQATGQTLPAVSYTMPAGIAAPETGPAPRHAFRTRIPVGDAELLRLKSLTGEALPNGPVLPEAPTQAGPDPLGVEQECATNGATGSAPSDIHGAASRQRLVVVTNVDVGVYEKGNCAVVSFVPLRTFFAAFGIPASETLFDPRVIYDFTNNRFFLTAESRNSGNTDQFQYFAVSTDGTATSWHLYRIVLSQGTTFFCKQATNSFWDYPNVGQNDRRWFITANDFGSTTTGAIISIDKGPTLAGNVVEFKCFNGLISNLAPPIVLDTSARAFFLSPGSGSGNQVFRRRLNTGGAVLDDTLDALSSIVIPAWTAPPDAVQPNGQRLDSLDGRFQSASIQIDNRLWNVHAINVGGFSRWRLYQFSTGGSLLFDFTPSTVAEENDHLFNPSVAVNSVESTGKAFVTFSRTIPSSGKRGRAAMLIADGPNASSAGWQFNLIETSSEQFVTDGFGTQCNFTSRGSCRWGDYSSTQINPRRSNEAWGFNQLIVGTDQFDWVTRAGKVK